MQRIFILIFILLSPLEALARGGGGGSGGGGGGGGHSSGGGHGGSGGGLAGNIFSYVFTAIILLAFISLQVHVFRKNQRRREAARLELNAAGRKDAAWEPTKLTERASSLFLAYQEAWCKNDTTWIETLCTPDFAERTILKMDVLRNMKREDVMIGTRITDIRPEKIHDDLDDERDLFVMRIIASADDRLIDKESGGQLFRENGSFIEFWTFNRIDNDWRIAGIKQATEDLSKTHGDIRGFAEKNKLFYEPDFGWLMLPTKGELFKRNKLGTSDINDHVIGRHRGKIVEFYTMRPYENADTWLVAQAILPIDHHDILIRPKKFFQITPIDMAHHDSESNAFDKVFTIDSDPKDNITTFELLTPDFMQYMLELPHEVTIEVVGNTVYFATRDIATVDYVKMLELLDKAFDAMKM